jgi:hypothetical protein
MSFLCGYFCGIATAAVSLMLVAIVDFVGSRRRWFGRKVKVVGKKGTPWRL